MSIMMPGTIRRLHDSPCMPDGPRTDELMRFDIKPGRNDGALRQA
ncbi:hypothetical protein D560_3062 [Bordetella holmesii ATCC 51541]|nr:hypothetical protein D560_3062 [Bordetella holmesii ATCC 51541]